MKLISFADSLTTIVVVRESAYYAENRIRIGYCKNYGRQEIQQAIAAFSESYPDVDMQILNGNHEELYEWLKNEDVDVIINDQRRGLSDAYINYQSAREFADSLRRIFLNHDME